MFSLQTFLHLIPNKCTTIKMKHWLLLQGCSNCLFCLRIQARCECSAEVKVNLCVPGEITPTSEMALLLLSDTKWVGEYVTGGPAGERDVRLVRQMQTPLPGKVPGPARVRQRCTAQDLILMVWSNNCTYCGGDIEDNYPPAALCLAAALFPIGILACLALKERQCVLCNRTSSAWLCWCRLYREMKNINK